MRNKQKNVCPLASYEILLIGALMSTRDKTKENTLLNARVEAQRKIIEVCELLKQG